MVGSDAHVDADVDEGLDPDPEREAGGEIALEVEARLRGEPRDVERAPDESDEEPEREQHAEQSQLLGEHREQEVGVRFGQVEELLHAVAEADAEPFAAPDRDQRLRQLEAAAVGVGPGVEEARQAPQPVGRGDGEQREESGGHRGHHDDVAQPRPRDEEHAETGGEEHRGGTEVGLSEQQHRHQRRAAAAA